MTDEKFIDKLNNYISKFGFYISKFGFKVDENDFDILDFEYLLVSKYSNSVRAVFEDIDELLNGGEFTDSVFEIFESWLKAVYAYADVPKTKNKIERYKSILAVKGKTKEEICLKIQMMGY